VHLPCEAVLEVSGVAWTRGRAVVWSSSRRKTVYPSHYFDLPENGGSGRAASEGVLSLQIGGATAVMMAGLTREQIMMIGGWSSAAVDRYLWALEMTRLRVSARMGL